MNIKSYTSYICIEGAGLKGIVMFHKPLKIKITKLEDNTTKLTCNLFGEEVEEYGTTAKDVLKELSTIVLMLYVGYAIEDDACLSGKAIELKKRILNDIKFVSTQDGDRIKTPKRFWF